jgi:Mrp family chromosome partitioning ATPase
MARALGRRTPLDSEPSNQWCSDEHYPLASLIDATSLDRVGNPIDRTRPRVSSILGIGLGPFFRSVISLGPKPDQNPTKTGGWWRKGSSLLIVPMALKQPRTSFITGAVGQGHLRVYDSRLRWAGSGNTMEPIDYVGALRRSWRLMLALALVGAVVAVLIPVGHGPHKKHNGAKWQASMIVGAAPAGGGNTVSGSVSGAQIQFYANTVAVQQAAANDAGVTYLGVPFPATSLSALFSASIVPLGSTTLNSTGTASSPTKKSQQSNLVMLTAYGTSESVAIALDNAYESALSDYLTNLAGQGQVTKSKTASPSTSGYTGFLSVRPAVATAIGGGKVASLTTSRKVRGLGGLVIGLLLGAAIVLLRELLDKRLRSAARAESRFGYPVLVEIPAARMAQDKLTNAAVDVVSDPGSPSAEAYRMLRMSVLFEELASRSVATNGFGAYENGENGSWPVAQPAAALPARVPDTRQVVLVVSAGVEPTRPQVAANLSAVYAEAGQRVVVISTGDVEAGGLDDRTASLPGAISPEDVGARLEPSWLKNVSRLPLAAFVGNSGQLVNRIPAVLEATRTLCDVVIMEAPPLLAVHHAEALGRAVDVVLVVGECGSTTFDQAQRAGDLLRRMGAPVLGVVLTNVRINNRDIRRTVVQRQPETPAPPDLNGDPVASTEAASLTAQTQA